MRRALAPRSGVAIVEFALVTPVVVFLMISFMQLGLILSSYVSVTDAARQGARAGIASGLTDNQRIAAAKAAGLGSACPGAATGFAQSTGTIDCTNGVKVFITDPSGLTPEKALPYTPTSAEAMDHPNRQGQLLTVKITWTVTMDLGMYIPTPNITVVAKSSMRIE